MLYIVFDVQDVQFSYVSADTWRWGTASCWPQEYQHKKFRSVGCRLL